MSAPIGPTSRLVDLSHVITDGMVTYPGLPGPAIVTHLSREAAEKIYDPGTTFQIGLVTLCTNTGTYVDVPFHRFASGHDLTGLPLERVADVPAVCLDACSASGGRAVGGIDLAPEKLTGLDGHAVLIRTDHSNSFGSDAYFHDHPFLTESAAENLVAAGVACVGIDSLNIDSTAGGERPVHTTLLGADIPIIEHLTNLASLPLSGSTGGSEPSPRITFRFTAVPPKIEGAGTFTVRAFAKVDP